jgi:hypothetical protein
MAQDRRNRILGQSFSRERRTDHRPLTTLPRKRLFLARVAVIRDCTPSRTVSGDQLEPLAPALLYRRRSSSPFRLLRGFSAGEIATLSADRHRATRPAWVDHRPLVRAPRRSLSRPDQGALWRHGLRAGSAEPRNDGHRRIHASRPAPRDHHSSQSATASCQLQSVVEPPLAPIVVSIGSFAVVPGPS